MGQLETDSSGEEFKTETGSVPVVELLRSKSQPNYNSSVVEDRTGANYKSQPNKRACSTNRPGDNSNDSQKSDGNSELTFTSCDKSSTACSTNRPGDNSDDSQKSDGNSQVNYNSGVVEEGTGEYGSSAIIIGPGNSGLTFTSNDKSSTACSTNRPGDNSNDSQKSDGVIYEVSFTLSKESAYVDLVKELMKEKKTYADIFGDKFKKSVNYYISERDQNYNRQESVALPLYFSIGKTHNGDPELKIIENAKLMHLMRIIYKMKFPEKFLTECIEILREKKREISISYLRRRKEMWPHDTFVKMCLLDVSFVINLIIKSKEYEEKQEWIEINENKNEVTFMKKSSILSDLLFFENQISFGIIDFIWKLLEKYKAIDQQEQLSEGLIKGVCHLFNLNEARLENQQGYESLLDLFHRALPIPNTTDSELEKVPAATELERVADIKFLLNEDNGFLDIITFKDGEVRLPLTKISIARKETLRSLLLFEYEKKPPKYKVFPYVYFMSCILRNGEDAKILMKASIFDNEMGSIDDVVKFYSDLWRPYIKESSFPKFEISKEINKYRKSKWKTIKAKTKRFFDTTPWIYVSVLGVLIIIALTVVQVIQDA